VSQNLATTLPAVALRGEYRENCFVRPEQYQDAATAKVPTVHEASGSEPLSCFSFILTKNIIKEN
jgi:hypothetical protein